jgi:hypothetical protein
MSMSRSRDLFLLLLLSFMSSHHLLQRRPDIFPIETILDIIMATCDSDGLYDIDETMNYRLVCRKWNDAIVSTSAFWNNIDLFRRGADEFLERSRTEVHVSLHMVTSYDQCGKPNYGFRNRVPKIRTNFNRISSLSLSAPSILFASDFNYHPVPHLRRLNLNNVAMACWQRYTDLTHLSLSGIGMYGPTADEVIAVFAKSPRLVKILLSGLDTTIDEKRSRQDTVRLRFVEAFELREMPAEAIAYILAHVYIPYDVPLRTTCGRTLF